MTFRNLLCMCTFVGGTHYQTRTSGRCSPGTEIKSQYGCMDAADYFDVKSLSNDNKYKSKYDPPGCYFDGHDGGKLKFNYDGGNTGYCTSYEKCVCRYDPKATTTTTGTYSVHAYLRTES